LQAFVAGIAMKIAGNAMKIYKQLCQAIWCQGNSSAGDAIDKKTLSTINKMLVDKLLAE
jgi:hypothetical protein